MGKRGGELHQRMNLLVQEQEKKKKINQLKRDTIRRVSFLQKKAVIETHDVYHLIRGFFKEFLGKQYEFTINELREELKNIYISSHIRKSMGNILDGLEAIEYANVHYKREELLQLLDEFAKVVHHLVQTHVGKKSFLAKIRDFFLKQETEPSVIIAELPVIESGDPENIHFHLLIEKVYGALDKHNLHRAKAAYKVLLKEYATLDSDTQEEYFILVDQTYQDILHKAELLKR